MAVGYGRNNSFTWTPPTVLPDCNGCLTFFDYARLSAQMDLYLPHKCVIVLQAQVGQPTDASGYIPMDLTTGLCPPSIVDVRVPDVDLDVPGLSGGRDINFDNSLTLPGDGTHYRSAPMDGVIAAPDAAIGVASDAIVSYTNIKNSDRGENVNVLLELFPSSISVSLIENLANLVAVDGTFQYSTNGGSSWSSLTPIRRWDGATTFELVVAFPSAVDGELQIRATYGVDAVPGSYTWRVTYSKDDNVGNERKLFVAEDSFTLTT